MINDNQKWIFVPGQNDDDAWTGLIQTPTNPQERASFEVVQMGGGLFINSETIFEQNEVVEVVVDFQKPSTMIWPNVRQINSGSGTSHSRTLLNGSFQHLLEGIFISDLNEKVFEGVHIQSESFRLWYAPTFRPKIKRGETDTLLLEKPGEKVFNIKGLGTLKCLLLHSEKRNQNSQTISPKASLEIHFSEARSLREVIQVVWNIESLFGFLIGFRLKVPTSTVWTKEKYKLNSKELPRTGELRMFNRNWTTDKSPNQSNIQHFNSDNSPGLESIVENFFQNRESFMSRINAINYSNLFSKSLEQSFKHIIPTFEEYLKSRFYDGEETNFKNVQKKFFDYIAEAGDDAITEFSLKHIKVVSEGKRPGLKQLINRAVTSLNDMNVNFPTDISKKINLHRGIIFHTTPKFDQKKVQELYECTRAASFMLTLLTYEDLGINPRNLELSRFRFGIYSDFVI